MEKKQNSDSYQRIMLILGIALIVLGIPLLALGFGYIAFIAFGILLIVKRKTIGQGRGVAVAVITRSDEEEALGEPRYQYRRVNVVGMKYLDNKRPVKKAKKGDPVKFVFEPENKYDPDAIRVEDQNGDKLGYIASGDMMQSMIHDFLNADEPVFANIDGVDEYGAKLHIRFYRPKK